MLLFDSTLNQERPSNLLGGVSFLKEISQLQIMTGFEIALKDFIACSSSVLFDHSKGLFSKNRTAQESAITYLVGRGKGLTPSGDDFLIALVTDTATLPRGDSE